VKIGFGQTLQGLITQFFVVEESFGCIFQEGIVDGMVHGVKEV
jgi:hypothetical protein